MNEKYFYAVKVTYISELDYEEFTEHILIYASGFTDAAKQLEDMYGNGLLSADINVLESVMGISTKMYDYLCNGEYCLENFGE